MSAGRHDLDIDQGETFVRVFEWHDSDGVLVDLTGYSAQMQIRDGGNWSLVLDVEVPGSIVIGGAAGTVTVTIPSDTTRWLPVGELLHYDLEVTGPTGIVDYLTEGKVRVREQVTFNSAGGATPFDDGLYTIDGGTP